ncbi:MAG: hypothetical protein ACFFD1_10445 [Candidatus Thorarchaeota archaeon]
MDIINLEKLLNELEPLMLEDGILSKDEEEILFQVKKDIKNFSDEYRKAWMDNKITKEEKKVLKNLWDNIYNDSYRVAKRDNNITSEEFKILVQILKTIVMDQ